MSDFISAAQQERQAARRERAAAQSGPPDAVAVPDDIDTARDLIAWLEEDPAGRADAVDGFNRARGDDAWVSVQKAVDAAR